MDICSLMLLIFMYWAIGFYVVAAVFPRFLSPPADPGARDVLLIAAALCWPAILIGLAIGWLVHKFTGD